MGFPKTPSFLESLLLLFIRLWVRTWRIQWTTPQPPRGSVIALWHQDLPACLAAFAHQNITVLISPSQDGDWFTRLAQPLGYQVYRGSSSRGQQSVKHLLKTLRSQQSVGMALDGPRGPAKIPKKGAFWLAQQASAPLLPVQVTYTAHFQLKQSWDQTRIPLPFALVRMATLQGALTKYPDPIQN